MGVARMSWWVAQLLLSGSWIHTSLLQPNYRRQRLKLCRAYSLRFHLSLRKHHNSKVCRQVSVRFSGLMALSGRYTFDGDPKHTADVWSGKSRISPSSVCGQDIETISDRIFQRDFLQANSRLEEIRIIVLDPGCGLSRSPDRGVVNLWLHFLYGWIDRVPLPWSWKVMGFRKTIFQTWKKKKKKKIYLP